MTLIAHRDRKLGRKKKKLGSECHSLTKWRIKRLFMIDRAGNTGLHTCFQR